MRSSSGGPRHFILPPLNFNGRCVANRVSAFSLQIIIRTCAALRSPDADDCRPLCTLPPTARFRRGVVSVLKALGLVTKVKLPRQDQMDKLRYKPAAA